MHPQFLNMYIYHKQQQPTTNNRESHFEGWRKKRKYKKCKKKFRVPTSHVRINIVMETTNTHIPHIFYTTSTPFLLLLLLLQSMLFAYFNVKKKKTKKRNNFSSIWKRFFTHSYFCYFSTLRMEYKKEMFFLAWDLGCWTGSWNGI